MFEGVSMGLDKDVHVQALHRDQVNMNLLVWINSQKTINKFLMLL